MASENILDPIQELLAQVQELVKLAQAENWQAMELLATDYQQKAALLSNEDYLKSVAAANVMLQFKSMIEQIQSLNTQLDEQVNTKREIIASELRHVMQADKALDAYRQ